MIRINRVVSVLAAVSAVLLSTLATPARAAEVSSSATGFESPIYSATMRGDIAITGNSQMDCSPQDAIGGTWSAWPLPTSDVRWSDCVQKSRWDPSNIYLSATSWGDRLDNNRNYLRPTDIDSSPDTYNSSKARLSIPAGAQVKWARVYWGGVGRSPSYNPDFASFQDPEGTRNQLYSFDTIRYGSQEYMASADVTELVRAGGPGNYTVGNIELEWDALNLYGGWSLIVAYEDQDEPMRTLQVFDGFGLIMPSTPLSVNVKGLQTPSTGDVRSKVGFLASEGDRGTTGDYLMLNGKPLSDAKHLPQNVFNGMIQMQGNPVSRDLQNFNNFNWDVSVINADNAIGNGATSTTIQATTAADYYFMHALTLSTEVAAPDIASNSDFQASNFQNRPARIGDTVMFAAKLQAKDYAVKSGKFVADIPAETSYIPGSLCIITVSGACTGLTDAQDSDAGSVSGGKVSVNVGDIPTSASTIIRYRTVVKDAPVDRKQIVSNAVVTGTDSSGAQNVSASLTAKMGFSQQVADLGLQRSGIEALQGELGNYTLRVVNNGPDAQSGTLRVVDDLDSQQVNGQGMHLESAEGKGWNCLIRRGMPGKQTVECGRHADLELKPGEATDPIKVTYVDGASSPAGQKYTFSGRIDDSEVYDSKPANDTSVVQVLSTPFADVEVKNARIMGDPSKLLAGREYEVALDLLNNGPSSMSPILEFSLPTGMIYKSASDGLSCSMDKSKAVCTLAASVRPDDMLSTGIKVAIDPAAASGSRSIVVEAVVANDPDLLNNALAITKSIARETDLAVGISAAGVPLVGSTTPTNVTLNTTNTGPSGLANGDRVTAKLTLPAGLTMATSSGQGWTCGAIPATVTLTCTFTVGASGIASGDALPGLVLGVTLASGAALVSDLVAEISTPTDTNTANNTSAIKLEAARADLAVSYSGSQPLALTPGSPAQVTFNVDVSNAGPNIADGFKIEAEAPASVKLEGGGSNGWTCQSINPSKISCSRMVGIIYNSSSALRLKANMPDPSAPVMGGLIAVSVVSPMPDPQPGNNRVMLGYTATPSIDLRMTKTANPTTVHAGQTVTYTLNISNNGVSTANGVNISDELSGAGLTFVSGTGCERTGTDAHCQIGTLAPSDSKSVTVTAKVPSSAKAGDAVTTARAVHSLGFVAPVEAQATVKVTQSASLRSSVSLNSGATVFVPGDGYEYSVKVDNDGPSDARDVTVTTTLAPQLTVAALGEACTVSGQNVTCKLSRDVPAGGSGSVVIPVQVAKDATGTVQMVVQAQAPMATAATSNTLTTAVGPPRPGRPAPPTVVPGSSWATVNFAPLPTGIKRVRITVTGGGEKHECTEVEPFRTGICTVVALTRGVTYVAQTELLNSSGWSPMSEPSAEFTPTTKPGKPVPPSIAVGDRSLVVSAQKPSGDPVVEYRFAATPGGASCTAVTPATSCRITGLNNGDDYSVTVVAANAAGDSPRSDAATGTPEGPLAAPDQPAAPEASPGEATGSALVEVTPGKPSPGRVPDKIVVTAQPGGASCEALLPTRSCTVTGLKDGDAYTFTAKAVNALGESLPSGSSDLMRPGVPAKPTGSVTAGPGAAQLTVTVNPPTAGGSVGVYQVTLEGPGSSLMCLISPPSNSCVVNTVDPALTYDVNILATNATGLSGTTIAYKPDQQPTAPTIGTPAFSANVTGDIAVIGNSQMACTSDADRVAGSVTTCANALSDPRSVYLSMSNDAAYNNDGWKLSTVDTDTVQTTTNSSSADLGISSNSSVLWARLYWGGTGTSDAAARKQVLLRTPTGNYQTVTGAQNVYAAGSIEYSASADVTDLVKNGGGGRYTVANIALRKGEVNLFGGWSLIVAYSDPYASMKSLRVFDGDIPVSVGKSRQFEISGLQTPNSPDVRTKVGIVASEGDRAAYGDYLSIGGKKLSDPEHAYFNLFNSTIGGRGARQPANINGFGWDAATLWGTGLVPAGAKNATVTAGTTGDGYTLHALTMSTPLVNPDMSSASEKSGLVLSPSGTRAVNQAKVGDSIRYLIRLRSKADNASDVVVTDGLVPTTTYQPGSLAIQRPGDVQPVPLTDGNDRDEGSFVDGQIRVNVGEVTTDKDVLIWYTAKVDRESSGRLLTNRADITGMDSTGNVSFATSVSAEHDVAELASDLSLSRSGAKIVSGGENTYNLIVNNAGGDTHEGPVTVNERLISSATGVRFSKVSGDGWSCKLSNASLEVTCTSSADIKTKNSSEAIKVTLAADQVDRSKDVYSLRGNVTSATFADPKPDNNTVVEPVEVVWNHSLKIQSIVPLKHTSGDDMRVAVTVRNDGPSPAKATLGVTLPAGVTYKSGMPTTGDWKCDAAAPRCTIGRFVGVSQIVLLTSTSPKINGDRSVFASLLGDDNKGSVLTQPINFSRNTDLSVGISPVAIPVAGDSKPTKVRARLFNNGQSSLIAGDTVTATFGLPNDLQVASATGTDWQCPGFATATGTLTCTFTVGSTPVDPRTTLAPLDLGVTLDAGASGPSPLSVEVSTARDANPVNDKAIADLSADTAADLAVSVQDVETVPGGPAVEFKANVTNNGPSNSDAPTVTLSYPSEVTLESADPGWICAPVGGQLTCDATGSLAKDDSTELTLKASVTDPAQDELLDRILVDVASSTPDPDTSNNQVSGRFQAIPDVAVSLSMTPSKRTVAAGETVDFDLTVTNAGPSTAKAAELYQSLENSGLEFVSSTSDKCEPVEGGFVACEIGDLDPGETQSHVFTARVRSWWTGETLTSFAAARSGQGSFLPVVTEDTIDVTSKVSLKVRKELLKDSDLVPTDAAVYGVTVTNEGPSEARDVQVVDTLPTGLSLVPNAAYGDGWACEASSQVVTCDLEDSVAVGTDANLLSIPVLVAPDASGSMPNKVTATATGQTGSIESNQVTSPVGPPRPERPEPPTARPGDASATIVPVVPAGTVDRMAITVTGGSEEHQCFVDLPAESSCTVTGLTNGRDFVATARARNSSGWSTESLPSEVFTPRAQPVTPNAPKVTPGDKRLLVSADPVAGDSVVNEYRFTATPGGAQCVAVAPSISCAITDLVNGQLYEVTVVAANSASVSKPSAATEGVPEGPIRAPGRPGAPTAKLGANKGSIVATSSVPRPMPGAMAEKVLLTAAPGGASCEAVLPNLTCELTGLIDGQKYTVTAKAVNALGESEPSEPSDPVSTGAPSTPNVTVTPGPEEGQLTISITTPGPGGDVDGYQVTVTGPGGTELFCSITAPATSCIVDGILPGVEYQITVTGVNPLGEVVTGTSYKPLIEPDSCKAKTQVNWLVNSKWKSKGFALKAGKKQNVKFALAPAGVRDVEVQWRKGRKAPWVTSANVTTDAKGLGRATITGNAAKKKSTYHWRLNVLADKDGQAAVSKTFRFIAKGKKAVGKLPKQPALSMLNSCKSKSTLKWSKRKVTVKKGDSAKITAKLVPGAMRNALLEFRYSTKDKWRKGGTFSFDQTGTAPVTIKAKKRTTYWRITVPENESANIGYSTLLRVAVKG